MAVAHMRLKSLTWWSLACLAVGIASLIVAILDRAENIKTKNDNGVTSEFMPLPLLPSIVATNRTSSAYVENEMVRFADRSMSEAERMAPMLNGTFRSITSTDGLALAVKILHDTTDEDTVRHEAANLLHWSKYEPLSDILWEILENEDEGQRFRSFAAQHLGLCWQEALSTQIDPAASKMHMRLIVLLKDKDTPVRREALWSLSQYHDVPALSETRRILITDTSIDASHAGMRDLAVRIAALHEWKEFAPQFRFWAGCSSCESEVRAASLDALAIWKDVEASPLYEKATMETNPLIQTAGLRGLSGATLASPP